MFREKRFDAGKVEINYADGPPNGPPLVLLHSLGGRWPSFYSILPSLAMRWHVKALDFRGHGGPGRVPGGYRVKDYYVDTLRFVEENLTEPAVLFGSSMGGWIATMLAANRPEKTRALIIGDSPLTIDYRDEISPFLAHIKAERDNASLDLPISELASKLSGDKKTPMARAKARSLIQLDPDVMSAWIEGMEDEERFKDYHEGYDLESLVESISCPILLLQANPETGGAMKYEAIEIVTSRLADAYHLYFEEFGHDLGISTWNTGRLLRAVVTFLESL